MTHAGSSRRLLLVHAHPDDETINNGATMAHYAAQGAQVTLITCTRGEQGEVIPAHLAHLAADVAGDGGAALGAHREIELAAALAALGVTGHRFLDASAAELSYVDSGMAYDHDGVVVPMPSPPRRAFAVQDAEQEAQVLAGVLREVRPHVVITYEPGGGYGHPDHVRAHAVTMRAVELAAGAAPADLAAAGPASVDGGAGWAVPKVYWVVRPVSLARAMLTAMDAVEDRPTGLDPQGRLPSMVIPDEQVTTCIDAAAHTSAKAAALRAHETQVIVTPDEAFFALSNGFYQPIVGLEFYRLVHGTPAPPFDDLGRETDLFAGL